MIWWLDRQPGCARDAPVGALFADGFLSVFHAHTKRKRKATSKIQKGFHMFGIPAVAQ